MDIMMMHQDRRSLGITLALGLAFAGTVVGRAGQEATNTVTLQAKDLPPAVQQALTEASKGATVLRIVRSPAIYNVRFDTNGQKSEIRVTEEGKVLRSRSKQEAEQHFEEETRLAKSGGLNAIPLESVPPAPRQVIVERSTGAKIEQIVKTPPAFAADLQVRIAEDGKIIGGTVTP